MSTDRESSSVPTTAELDLALYELFLGKEELLPLWLRLRAHVESFGPDVKLTRRDRYAEFDRVGAVFAIVEPAAHRRMEIGVHNPGLPFDDRFRDATGFGSRRITHRVVLAEDADIDDDLHARLHDAYASAWQGEPR
jgi:hypothetical protein